MQEASKRIDIIFRSKHCSASRDIPSLTSECHLRMTCMVRLSNLSHPFLLVLLTPVFLQMSSYFFNLLGFLYWSDVSLLQISGQCCFAAPCPTQSGVFCCQQKAAATPHPRLVLMDRGDLGWDPEPAEDLLKCNEDHMDFFFCNSAQRASGSANVLKQKVFGGFVRLSQ